MAKIEGIAKEVMDKTEWVAILSWGPDGPHMSATWGEYVRRLGFSNDEVVVIPAGGLRQTEENLNTNPQVQLLIASKTVGTGQGCRISGRGEIQTSGLLYEAVKREFDWARGALVVTVEDIKTLL